MPAGSHSIKTKGSVVCTHAVQAAVAAGGNGLGDGRQPRDETDIQTGERERERKSAAEEITRH